MASPPKSPAPDVHIVQVSSEVDHLHGVELELSARGLSVSRQDETYRPPRVRKGTRVVVVTDLFDPRCVRALRMARRVGAKSVLMMDGLTDWRNTFTNPRAGDGFLRPAPVDLVCCSGMIDCHVLRSFGNNAVATGLPRIDAQFGDGAPVHVPGPVLVATANNPTFNADERARLLVALRELKQASRWARSRLLWRLTDGLDDELGVKNQQGPLPRVLDNCGSVITTASTLQIEAMRAGKPTAILHPHNTPLWQPAAFVWQPIDSHTEHDTSGVSPMVKGLARWVDSPERLLKQLARPTQEQMQRQGECLRLIDASSGEASAAELVAEAIAELAHSKKPPSINVPLRPIARLPSRKPKRPGRRRVVSIVPFDDSPIGGVTTWSRRLSDAFEQSPAFGYDLHTLLVATNPRSAHRAEGMLGERTSLCVLDPMDDHFVTLSNLRRAVENLEPDVVAPNYSDLSHAVATQLRYTGVRTLAIAHTDHAYYSKLLAEYPQWDAAVAVSSSIQRWLAPLAGQKPRETIVYGVPTSANPRIPKQQGPIKLAYVGRIARVQKRVMDLVPMVNTLAAIGVEAELHVVGDGPDRRLLAQKLKATGSVRVVHHGGQSPEWVEAFWPTIDVAVLVSEYEGTSITMLEAMGQGVVPAVTRVESGVNEWVRDDISGITAPVGKSELLARKIAELSSDRAKLAALGSNAWNAVSVHLGIDAMASQYAEVLDAMSQHEICTRPSLAGVTIGTSEHWFKRHTEDADGEVKWLVKRLTEAGYRSVAVGEPGESSDAVIIPAGDAGPDEQTASAWNKRGIDIAWSALMPDGGFFARQLRRMVDAGCKRIAVYGIGQHSQRYADTIESGDFPVVGFIDDKPPATKHAFGLPVETPANAAETLAPDGVLLSSDTWEESLWNNTRHLREAGILVRAIYGSYQDAPANEPVSV